MTQKELDSTVEAIRYAEWEQRAPQYRKRGMPAMATLYERKADEMENQIRQELKAMEGELL